MIERIEYVSNERLPKLGWFARLELARDRISVAHGESVECNDEWMIEGVWDGPFADGKFHESEHVFGSGIRLQDGAAHFVPSRALVDRILYCVDGDDLLASNSLPILLAMTGARLDLRHDYRTEARTIMKGIDAYDPTFRVVHPRIACFYQLYYRPLRSSRTPETPRGEFRWPSTERSRAATTRRRSRVS
jgi:hypothetical protein